MEPRFLSLSSLHGRLKKRTLLTPLCFPYCPGTGFEGISVKDLALMTSREPSHASVFNYASMAHNNHFFFDGLSVSGGEDPSEHMPEDLKVLLEDSFGSLETLQRELVLTADAMFGPGFVWLVRQAGGPHGAHRFPFKVLVTYLAGSPYPAAHWRRQGTDMNNQGGMSDKSGDIVREYFQMQKMSNNSRGTTGAGSSTTGGPSANNFQSVRDRNPGGTNLVPVLCVNTWEHAWLHDWRVGGKFNYLAAWWNVINWGKVAERASLLGGRQMTTTGNPLRAAEGGAWTGSG